MTFGPRFMPRREGGARGLEVIIWDFVKNVISTNVFWNKLIQIVYQTLLHLLAAPCRS